MTRTASWVLVAVAAGMTAVAAGLTVSAARDLLRR